ncbi:hypothetical protein M407DRAFT_19380 [Tulasnella calospora MUT 4182]|uniref:Uncharacterized protein n=1 Tax=Tulasnella calospora MUT 4182 TaxID=1051891 RepID=A0A0C3MCY8_9AGAM|nr:hypothetical protein M407DRAFT_19380 [Tulasnella calospora MUT 4182]
MPSPPLLNTLRLAPRHLTYPGNSLFAESTAVTKPRPSIKSVRYRWSTSSSSPTAPPSRLP